LRGRALVLCLRTGTFPHLDALSCRPSALRSVAVVNFDNPAGRLLELLVSYNEVIVKAPSPRKAWGEVLGLKLKEVPLHLWQVERLMLDTFTALSRADQSVAYLMSFEHHRETLLQPFRTNLDTSGQPVDDDAMMALNTISAFLSSSASEGTVPDVEEVRSLKDEVLAAIDETRDTDDAPLEVRQLIGERLHQILWALDHVHIGGPAAVREAVERLAGSLAISGREAAESAPAKRSWKVVQKVWSAFRAGPVVLVALEAWPDVAERMLELGP
jgi:hypothetical protein